MRIEKKASGPGGAGARPPPFAICPGDLSHLGDTQGPDSLQILMRPTGGGKHSSIAMAAVSLGPYLSLFFLQCLR